MEQWSNEELIKMGEFVKKHGIPDGAEEELIKYTEQFAKVCKEFKELNEEQKQVNRQGFYEVQSTFFEVGVVANLFMKKKETEVNTQGAMSIAMQTDNQPGASASAVGGQAAIVRKIPVNPTEDIPWLPYLQYRKILQPCLELESGNLTNNTMSDIHHAIGVAKQKARAFDFHINGIEQAILAIVHSKFDVISKGIWEFQLGTLEPTIESLERFLEQRSYMIQNELGSATPVLESGSRRKTPLCIYCKSTTHTIYKCSSGFEALTIPAKKRFLRGESRCENCFMRHPNDICTSGSCWTCKIQHNSMLCPENPKNK